MSRVLVTGASGFVGAAVVRRALEQGHDPVALVGSKSHLGRIADLDVRVVRADITGPLGDVIVSAAPDVCIHLAAAGAVVRDNDLDRLFAANALAPARLAHALADVGASRLVTAGSSSEYGTPNGAMDESLACNPDDPYGVSKLAGGLLARLAGRSYGIETAHLRLFSVYGPREDPRRLVASVVHSLVASRPIDLTPGEQVRDFVYVDDVADALLAAAFNPGIDGVTANVGTGVETTVRDLCLRAAAITGGRELLRFGARPYRDGERFHWRAATEHAERLLGWKARTSLDEGLRLTIDAARDELALEAA